MGQYNGAGKEKPHQMGLWGWGVPQGHSGTLLYLNLISAPKIKTISQLLMIVNRKNDPFGDVQSSFDQT